MFEIESYVDVTGIEKSRPSFVSLRSSFHNLLIDKVIHL